MAVRRLVVLFVPMMTLCLLVSAASANNSRLGLHILHVEPNGGDAEQFAEASLGGNIEVVLVPPGVWDAMAFTFGFDGVLLDSQTTKFRDRTTGLRVEQQTRQNFFRLFLGGRVGHQGHGFIRPYIGANIALNIFTYDTDVVIPDDTDPENEIRQSLEDETETAFGFDTVLGVELNFNDKWFLDGGAKYIKTFNVPQQLGDDAKTIHPQYFQIFVGGGFMFDFGGDEE